jgi:putative oxidoreductase
MSLSESVFELGRRAHRALDFCAPVVDLVLRLWVAGVFFRSGLTKIGSWDTTILLFTNEYHVPFLSPELAAFAGTATELVVPVFLALGLGGRLAAAVLFVFNIVAVISYPELEGIGIEQHQVWGIMLLVTLLHGPGRLSTDHLIARWLGRHKLAGRGDLAPV